MKPGGGARHYREAAEIPQPLPSAGHSPAKAPEVSPNAFVHWARSRASALPQLEAPDAKAEAAFRKIVGTARIVALGEPAHGAHEPLELRNQLFRFLVTRMGFTAVALESGFTEARHLNDFVQGGSGDAARLAEQHLSWGFGRYAENVELINWIRQLNASGPTRKISFYGFDLSGGMPGGRFTRARVALDAVLSFLTHSAPVPVRNAARGIRSFLESFSSEGYTALSHFDRAALSDALSDLQSLLERERPVLTSAGSRAEFEWALQNLTVARQLEAFFQLLPEDSTGSRPSSEFYRAAEARDAAMAQNLRWILEREGPSGRVLVFGHNAHVMNASLRGGIWNVYRQAPLKMGHHLKATLQSDIVIVGTSSAADGAAAAGSLDAALSTIGHSNFLLDLRAAGANTGAADWLDQPQSIRANHTTEMVLRPNTAFDAIAYVDALTPARVAPPDVKAGVVFA